MPAPTTLRRDARDNVAKLRAAARDVFLARGLGAPLDEIASAAGVSIGTLYNRFGTREALIDSVVPDVVGQRLRALAATVAGHDSPRARLEAFAFGMIDLQADDPALSDAILRRYPEAEALIEVCDHAVALGHELVRAAHDDGSLSEEFTEGDLFNLIWLAGVSSRDPDAPTGWQRTIRLALTAAWTMPEPSGLEA